MAESLPNELIDQLQAPQPKVRKRAIRRLAASGDPSVIPLLRNVYLQDGDDQVRDAAEAALARFRAMQHNPARHRRPARGDRARRWMALALAIVLLGLIAANITIRALGQDDDRTIVSAGDANTAVPRNELEQDLHDQLAGARAAVTRLRESDRVYRETGALACDLPGQLPAPLELSAATRQNYERDLTPLADRLGLTLALLHSAQTRWDQMCAVGEANMVDVVGASAELDQVTVDLDLFERDLATAIASPAPTHGPSPTPTDALALPGGGAADAATLPPAPSATATATPTATPTPLPTVTPTPPTPNLEYPIVLRELSNRLIILGDLQRPYNNGMLDNWQRSEQGETVSTLSCTLDPWPGAFEWSPAERAQLDQPHTADPQLEEAVRLLNEGLRLAFEARAIYEPSCYNQTLASSAANGVPLATQAREILLEAQQLIEEIRRRPSQ